MENKEMAYAIAELLDSKKAKEVVVIDIAEKSSFADYFVNASASSERQLGALANEVEDRFAQEGIIPKNSDGRPQTGWILIDGGDIIVNLFTQDVREKYTLERLWSDCEMTVVRN